VNQRFSEPLRILLVDDCADVCASLAMLVRMWGYDVRTVGDGFAGLKVAEEYLPHVILLDVGLPSIDGYEVARRLRAQSSLEPQPRIITISGNGLEEDFRRSRAVGCDRHLVKPVDLMDLRLMLAQYAELARRQFCPSRARSAAE
jgi:CheY-like chemotaxis protein